MSLYRNLFQSSRKALGMRNFSSFQKVCQINSNNILQGLNAEVAPEAIEKEIDIKQRLNELIPEYHQIGTKQMHSSPYTTTSDFQSSYELTMAQMLESGLHLGANADILNQKNLPYIYGTRAGISVFNLELTLAHLKRACGVVKEVSRKGGLILFLSHQPQLAESTIEAAKRAGAYYQYTRWVPGTITNREIVLKQSQYYERDPDSIQLDEGGQYYHTPDLLVVMNYSSSKRAIAEATKANIPTISIIDSDQDPTGVTYPIPGNDDSLRALKLVLGVLSKAGEEGVQLRELEKRKKREQSVKDHKQAIAARMEKHAEQVASGYKPDDLD
ncbi:ribosomal protein S2 [Conidiobolus coronatus NRRL 28638]|uniref:Ribosomal protein S2 n=1 Tax=Conidiobolus coronatus (strain ATCC 28846 / CBS 209.66 / NRRL 28638) TaxID=796925 RepID=A0A137PB08_CONC2|nr:ribosomal protein S2 [Conidiobolus coronatus NRRL 28638]|eukprot:KXN72193.1 ribosomal protein S2 [Conidiobolus coronatus NRRL 28638]